MDIDKEIAEEVLRKVFGADDVWIMESNFFHAIKSGYFIYEGICDDWNFGGLVVEKMFELGWRIILQQYETNEFDCRFVKGTKDFKLKVVTAETAPLAICKAALEALK